MKTIRERRGFSPLNLQSVFKWSVLLQIAVLSLIIVQLPATGQAQGNLVNLYSWTDDSTPYTGFIDINSSTSAMFIGNYANFPAFNHLNLSGDFDTTPGETYEISFTLQNGGQYTGSGSTTFGSTETDLDYALSDSDSYFTNGGYEFLPVNYYFTSLATSANTTMSFNFILDEGESAELSNFAITEITPVPEISASRLFCYGGCVFLIARQLRKLTQRQKLAVKPIA